MKFENLQIVPDAGNENCVRITSDNDRHVCKVYGYNPEEARAKAEAIVAALNAANEPTTSKFNLTWIAAPRGKVHPKPMIGRQSFSSIEGAIHRLSNCAPDSRFVSLTETISRTVDRSEEARQLLPECYIREDMK